MRSKDPEFVVALEEYYHFNLQLFSAGQNDALCFAFLDS
jgi:hypothetical protein